MRFTKTEAYASLAKKNREGENDIDDKFNILGILRNKFSLYGLTGEILMIDDKSCRMPDILVKGVIPIVIELDGLSHGEAHMPNDKTLERNKDYQDIGVKLIIINKELTNGYEPSKVIEVLINNGLKQKC